MDNVTDTGPAVPGCTDAVLVRSGIPQVYRCLRQGTTVSALVYPVRVDAGTAAVFAKQAKALQGVDHPQVARVLEPGTTDGYPYLITTADTGTLADQLRDQLRSPADLAVLGQQLAEGLAAIHAAGLIHGGLTPGAVVLQQDGRPQLSALTLGLGQHTGHAALNSPSQLYIAPETLRDGTLTAASDLYALGAVLYAAGSGKPPLAARMGETAGEHILRVLNDPPAGLDVLPDSFAELVARLLEKDPAKRPGSAAEVAAALGVLAASTTPMPAARSVAPATAPVPKPAAAIRPRPTVLKRKDLPSWPAATNPNPQPPPQPQPQPAPQPVLAPPTPAPVHQEQTPPPQQPAPPKQRSKRLLVAGGVVLAAALITGFALANRKDQTDQPPISAPTPTQSSTPALVITLNPPVDHSTYVELSWSGPPDVNYAVVVAQAGQKATTKLVYKQTKYRVAVVPGVQYCFAIQATDGLNPAQSQSRPIRDARCEGR